MSSRAGVSLGSLIGEQSTSKLTQVAGLLAEFIYCGYITEGPGLWAVAWSLPSAPRSYSQLLEASGSFLPHRFSQHGHLFHPASKDSPYSESTGKMESYMT